jgi:glycosyltransferase involved in cell wall biosynthesis
LKTARAVIANGSWNAKIYRELCPWGTPVYSVPYYLDAEQYTQTSKNHSMQARLSLPKRNNDSIEFRFVFAGSLTRRKGVDRLARIFRKVTALSPHTILYVAGAGPCENEMKEILRGTPHDNVTFLGNLGMHEISTLFSFVNALVFPTQFDGWGMVVNEAMACGLPVITTTTCGAAHDLVSPGRNGYILEPNDDEGFVEKMVYLSRHPDVAKDMGQAARDSILEHSPKNGAEILYHACLDILQRS